MQTRFFTSLLLVLLAVSGAGFAQDGELVVYLVRHAEKQVGADPGLTEQGQLRAMNLAAQLREAGIDAIYSTDTKRTRHTAGPIAAALGLKVQLYDGQDLEDLAHGLKDSRGVKLVVGHSDTTPELVRILGGEPGPAIEDSEYDRVYELTRSSDGGMKTVLLRSEPASE